MFKTHDHLPLVVPCSHLTNPYMRGYLDKKRPSKKLLSIKYQRRWCVVYGNFFIYYDTPDDKGQKGSFSLEGYRFLHSPGHGPFGFSLVSNNKRMFEFMAPTNEAYFRWESAIKKGIALTRRSTVPVVRKTEGKKSHHEDIQQRRAPQKLDKAATLPLNMGTTPRPKITPTSFGSFEETILPPEPINRPENDKSNIPSLSTLKSATMIQSKPLGGNKIIERPDNKPVVTILKKRKQNNSKNKQGNSSSDSSDSDDEGYIKPERLNPKEPEIKCAPQTSENLERVKSYTEDDYMKILPDEVNNTKEIEYMEVQPDGRELIYCNVENREGGPSRHDPDYASVRRRYVTGSESSDIDPTILPSSTNNGTSSSSSSSDEDDFIDPLTVFDYCKVDDLLKRLSADYEKVDNLKLLRKSEDESSSSRSDDSDDLNDVSKEDDYAKVEDFVKNDFSKIPFVDKNSVNRENPLLSVINDLKASPYMAPVKEPFDKKNQEVIYENFKNNDC